MWKKAFDLFIWIDADKSQVRQMSRNHLECVRVCVRERSAEKMNLLFQKRNECSSDLITYQTNRIWGKLRLAVR